MLSIVLAAAAAVGYGTSDFAGGVAARRGDARLVALVSQAVALGVAVLLVALPLAGREPGRGDLAWGAAAGFGSALGNVLIYRGIAHHGATAVAPTSGIVAVAVPVAAALTGGETIGIAPMVGIALAVPAIWLVSSGNEGRASTGGSGSGVVVGAAAGAGFGTQFACLGQTSASGGMVPLAASQAVSVAVLLLAVLSGAPVRGTRPALSVASVAGLCAGLATAGFQVAARVGDLAVAAAITSLYPAVTVVIAAAAARTWWTRREGTGLLMAAVALLLFSR